MKCKLIDDGEAVNPLWLAAKDPEGIVPIIVVPAGTVIEHVDAWRLCAIGTAVPEDEECHEAVRAHMSNPRRLELLDNVRQLIAADGVQQLDAKSKKWLDFMRKSYARELESPAPEATEAAKPAKVSK